MKQILFLLFLLSSKFAFGQTTHYSAQNAHSHNDYEQAFPFWQAWQERFGSIEVDLFLYNGQLLVAHDSGQLKKRRRFDSLYLQPLQQCLQQNKGHIYPDSTLSLQIMVDIKTGCEPTLQTLIKAMEPYPELINNNSLKWVISGNRPTPEQFEKYPRWLSFDGNFSNAYTENQYGRVAMLSDNFRNYTRWNGKGRLPEAEQELLYATIKRAHDSGKKVRFWNAPDFLNSWYQYIDLGADFINTDDIPGLAQFFKQLPDRSYQHYGNHELYQPGFRNDGASKPVRNIILLVGDGTGLAQRYAGYTANQGKLNVFSMNQVGLSKTSSFDNFITDSAPGATAFSSGTKTNNRAVGVAPTGKPLLLLPELMRKAGKKTGLITSGDFRDATPAAFYAHQSERSNYNAILKDLLNSSVDLLVGACDNCGSDSLRRQLETKFSLRKTIDSFPMAHQLPAVVVDAKAALPASNGRGEWLIQSFEKTVKLLGAGNEGFFLMLEAAQIDHGGHANKLPYAVSELLDFDKVIGAAMRFADSNGETLIIVTGDHETGGLTLTGGNYDKGKILGQFSTGDHTAIPVPVFAYGPQSQLFQGVYENTAIFEKIVSALDLQ